jgi:aspartate-semialdehyde dehydrogenase
MKRTKAGLRVGVVGATGMVGSELLPLLEKRRFPVSQLLPFSSGAARKSVLFGSRNIPAPGVSAAALASCDLVFFVSSDEISARLAPRLAARGVWVIDDSSAFRQAPGVPLVIPEVNADHLRRSRRLVAGPNCTMTGLAVAAYPLHVAAGIREVRVASYQAVSGAGRAALSEFASQSRDLAPRLAASGPRAPILAALASSAMPSSAAFNVFPQVGSFDKEGVSSEERKVAAELRKVWGAPGLKVSVTAVRVPAVRGHSLAAWVTLARPLGLQRARSLLSKAPGLTLSPEGRYPTPLTCGGKDGVYAGRLRAGIDRRELCLWIVSDNLLKGAALNSVEIAEELLRRGWLRPSAGRPGS